MTKNAGYVVNDAVDAQQSVTTPTSKASSKRGKGLTRFSLRFFLLLITGFCIALPVLVHRAERQKQGVEFVRNYGGSIRYDFQFDASGKFDPTRESKAPEKLIETLGIDFFHSVENVRLVKGFDIFEKFLAGLAGTFGYFISRDETIRDLCKAFPKLRQLTIESPYATKKSLQSIGKLSRLENLRIKDCRLIDDRCIEQLGNLKRLKTLYLESESRVTDEGLKVIASLPRLERFSIQSGFITPEGRKYFAEHTKLKQEIFNESSGIFVRQEKKVAAKARQ